jgi:hypothetical protein
VDATRALGELADELVVRLEGRLHLVLAVAAEAQLQKRVVRRRLTEAEAQVVGEILLGLPPLALLEPAVAQGQQARAELDRSFAAVGYLCEQLRRFVERLLVIEGHAEAKHGLAALVMLGVTAQEPPVRVRGRLIPSQKELVLRHEECDCGRQIMLPVLFLELPAVLEAVLVAPFLMQRRSRQVQRIGGERVIGELPAESLERVECRLGVARAKQGHRVVVCHFGRQLARAILTERSSKPLRRAGGVVLAQLALGHPVGRVIAQLTRPG